MRKAPIGFLHAFYYQTLEHLSSPKDSPR
jgi:hypothetical protein